MGIRVCTDIKRNICYVQFVLLCLSCEYYVLVILRSNKIGKSNDHICISETLYTLINDM
jgi:hypothetical protein